MALHMYNNICIPQMGICQIVIINEGIKYKCSFFVVPGNGSALLGMPECKATANDCEPSDCM